MKCLLYLFVLIGFSIARAGSFDDFFRAVKVGDAGTVRQLLARGFDPNTADEAGQIGLIIATQVQSSDVVRALLDHPAIRIDLANAAGETPLMVAALRGDLALCKELLARGAAVNRTGWTPLHYAASGPSTEVVRLLLAHGAALEARSPNGTTPLMMAARYGAEDSALTLLGRGADTGLRNDRGLDAADFARLNGRHTLADRLAARPR